MVIRALRWPEEFEAVEDLDAGFTSARIYHVTREGFSFVLSEKKAFPPVHKTYSLSKLATEILPSDHTFGAEFDGALVGLASMRFENWNRRAMLRHLYISAKYRGRGAGRALVDAALASAATVGARCLWAETQNINYPAVQFYLRLGFQLCGLDTSLYDNETPGDPAADIGLFFSKTVGK